MRVAAVIAAAGRGVRAGGATPKQWRVIGGRTLLEHALTPFERSGRVDEIVVVLPPEAVEDPPPGLQGRRRPLRIVAGGARRQDSVAAGVDAVAPDAEIVLVHDAARPFCPAVLIGRTIEAAAETGAAVPALRVADTVKAGAADGGRIVVRATVPRADLYLAQTPQGFRRRVLREAVALGRRGVDATDEAMLAERAGHPVRLIDGDPDNVKVTTPADVERAAARLARAAGPGLAVPRIGLGCDTHRTAAGRPLMLGGVPVPHDRGLAGHSDADAVCHAMVDALLGAAAAGDIGRHFPDRDARWKDAAGLDLLRRAVDVIAARGFVVGNVDVVVIAEQPRLAPHVDAMRARLADVLGVGADAVSIKATTAEGLDAVGRGEAITAHAVALLVPRW